MKTPNNREKQELRITSKDDYPLSIRGKHYWVTASKMSPTTALESA